MGIFRKTAKRGNSPTPLLPSVSTLPSTAPLSAALLCFARIWPSSFALFALQSRLLSPLIFALLIGLPALAQGNVDEPVAPHIQSLLKGGAEANRALERLRFIGPERAGPPLRQMLETGNDQSRIAASSALILLRDPKASELLVKALSSDSDWEVRQNAAIALGELGELAAAPTLASRLISDPHRRVRRACAMALGKLKTQPRALLTAAGTDDSLEVQLAALDAVRHMSRDVQPGLRRLLKDDSAMLRFGAARALAFNDDPAAKDFLKRQLKGDTESRRRAIAVLGDLDESPWTSALLVESLKSSDLDTKLSAASALAKRGQDDGLWALFNQAMGPSHPHAEAAARTLQELGYDASDFIGPPEAISQAVEDEP